MGSKNSSSREYKLLVIGKSGNGKSALCNKIIGKHIFTIGHTLSATTKHATFQDVTKNNTEHIRVVDTPDITNCEMTSEQLRDEIETWKDYTQPGPTAVILTVRCDTRYTAEEYDIYRQIKSLLGAKYISRRLLIAFTFGDRLDRDIETELKTASPELKKVVKKAKGYYFVLGGKMRNSSSESYRATGVVDLNCCSYCPSFMGDPTSRTFEEKDVCGKERNSTSRDSRPRSVPIPL